MSYVTMLPLLSVLTWQALAVEACQASDFEVLIRGCWQHEGFRLQDTPDKPKLINSQLACFNDKGVATGVTFDDGDGWEWIDIYSVEDGALMVGGTSWGRVLDVSATKLLLLADDKLRAYDIVCRLPEENVQCERLQYIID